MVPLQCCSLVARPLAVLRKQHMRISSLGCADAEQQRRFEQVYEPALLFGISTTKKFASKRRIHATHRSRYDNGGSIAQD